jgi:hypothetical protein
LSITRTIASQVDVCAFNECLVLGCTHTCRVSTHAIPGLTPVLLSGSSSGLLVVVVVVVVVPAGSPVIQLPMPKVVGILV